MSKLAIGTKIEIYKGTPTEPNGAIKVIIDRDSNNGDYLVGDTIIPGDVTATMESAKWVSPANFRVIDYVKVTTTQKDVSLILLETLIALVIIVLLIGV